MHRRLCSLHSKCTLARVQSSVTREAREWALGDLRGFCPVITPSYSLSLQHCIRAIHWTQILHQWISAHILITSKVSLPTMHREWQCDVQVYIFFNTICLKLLWNVYCEFQAVKGKYSTECSTKCSTKYSTKYSTRYSTKYSTKYSTRYSTKCSAS